MGTCLVLLDGSAFAERALPYASALVGRPDDGLVLLRVAPAIARVRETNTPPRDLFAGPPGEPSAPEYLEAVAASLRAAGVRAEPRAWAVYDAPAGPEQVASAVADVAADAGTHLVVMTAHGRTGLARLLYGSVAEAVLRSATTPVLLIPPGVGHSWTEREPRRLLVPNDGSALADAALGPAAEFAVLLRAELLVVRVLEPPEQDFRFGARQALEEHVAGMPELRAVTVHTCVEVGEPAEAIAAVAREQDAMAIVMATHGRTGLARLTMGSVVAGVLRHARVPLLLVSPGAAARRLAAVLPEPEWLTR